MAYLKLFLLLMFVLMDRWGIIINPPRAVKEIPSTPVNSEKISPIGTWRCDLTGPQSFTTISPFEFKTKNKKDSVSTLVSFFPDSTYTEVNNQGVFTTGRWMYSKSDGTVQFNRNPAPRSYCSELDYDQSGLRLMKLVTHAGDSLQLAGFGKSMEAFRTDPYYEDNNVWRLKPAHAETKKEVLARLRNYILHSARLLHAADERRQQLISWEFSKGILQIYKSGIGIVPQEAIPEEWIATFYSREQAYLAHAILEDFLITTTYRGQSTGNWVKDDYAILMNIYQRLEKRNLAEFKSIQ